MALLEINKDPSAKDLRWFGIILAVLFSIFGLLARFQFGAPAVAQGLFIAAAATCVVYYAVRPIQRPLFIAWMYLVFPIGFTISFLILAITYYLVLTPVGLVLRLFGKHFLERGADPSATSYWIQREPITDPKRYLRQF